MGPKAESKRNYILAQAQHVFAAKGYKDVTMKDIIAACQISRGGVYLYFKSTSEIYEAILLRQAKENHSDETTDTEDPNPTATRLMQRFLAQQKQELLHPSDSLIIATYEYLFAQRQQLDPSALESRFSAAAAYLQTIIQRGIENEEFVGNASTAAQHIIFCLEGLRMSSTVLALDEAQIDAQLAYMMDQLTSKTHHSE
ncbi:hypothetical protein PA598K_01733 [Paenibacillus sp. 598K]|uniref:TetR/AcrR family transcriptional regulator n=1 Tax=Paenibacillus sp. 598K TaxID=1117987 RepID=UPI000FF96A59|nr:TetR/AcrR family transcriptional regulator [Paenibacillus sp. 598K]GBF73444.1 hypothetical protein PA598K_01733 [Paenibacillus sp. 598K]